MALLIDLPHDRGSLATVLERSPRIETISKLAGFHRRSRAAIIAREPQLRGAQG